MGKLIDMRGMIFGRLTVLAQGDTSNDGRIKWWCLCECGELAHIDGSHIRAGKTTSCGCYQKIAGMKNKRHGDSKTRLHKIWQKMRYRCNNQKSNRYYCYGGKGVTICSSWDIFENFRDWALSNGYSDNLTIDRINSDGNYEPSNCEWVTRSENNKRMWRQRNESRN